MCSVHPTAIVEDGASIGPDVVIGPGCVVGAQVTLEDGVRLHSNIIVDGRTVIGARTKIWPFAVIGSAPQDLNDQGEDTELVIGADCLIREHVTIHRGTRRGRGRTIIGHHCFLMVSSHLAHDCIVGNHVIMSNQSVVAGHCELQDHAILSGLTAIQQRVRIGAHAFVGGLTGVNSHVVPYAMVLGNRAEMAGLNIVGLKRRGFERRTIRLLRQAYRHFFDGEGSRQERLSALRKEFSDQPEVQILADFIAACGSDPVTLPRQG